MRVGPKMKAVMEYVADHPGCTKMAAAKHAWNLSTHPVYKHTRKYRGLPPMMVTLYGPVNRALDAGLIFNRSDDPRRAALYIL